MFVKGTAFIARKHEMVARYSERRWSEFVADLAERYPFFAEPVVTTTQIPIESFLGMQELLLEEFFGSTEEWAYRELGELSARWTFTSGPYSTTIDAQESEEFIEETMPTLWRVYYDFGSLQGRILDERSFEFWSADIPVQHPHFITTVPAFIVAGLKIRGVVDLRCEHRTPVDSRNFSYLCRHEGWR